MGAWPRVRDAGVSDHDHELDRTIRESVPLRVILGGRATPAGGIPSKPSRICLDCHFPLTAEEQAKGYDLCRDCGDPVEDSWDDASNGEPLSAS